MLNYQIQKKKNSCQMHILDRLAMFEQMTGSHLFESLLDMLSDSFPCVFLFSIVE